MTKQPDHTSQFKQAATRVNRIYFLSILILLSSSAINAQDAALHLDETTGPMIPVFVYADQLTGHSYWLIHNQKGHGCNLEEYDSLAKKINSKLINPTQLQDRKIDDAEVQSVKATSNGFVVLSTQYNKKLKEYSFLIQSISRQGENTSAVKEVCKGKTEFYLPLQMSPNGKFVFVGVALSADKSKHTITYSLMIFDQDLQQIGVKTFTIPKKTNITHAVVTNESNFLFTTTTAGSAIGTELWYVSRNDNSARQLPVLPSGNRVGNISIETDPTGKPHIIGFYYDRNDHYTKSLAGRSLDNRRYTGAFVCQLTNDDQITDLRIVELPDSVPRLLQYGDDVRDAAITCKFKKDRGIILLEELYYYNHSKYYCFSNLLAASINPDGSLAYARSVPKHQAYYLYSGETSFFCSYMSIYNDDDKTMKIIANDNSRNLNPDRMIDHQVNRKRNVPIIYSIDDSGKLSTVPMAEKNTGTTLAPQYSAQVSAHRILFFGVALKEREGGFVSVHF